MPLDPFQNKSIFIDNRASNSELLFLSWPIFVELF